MTQDTARLPFIEEIETRDLGSGSDLAGALASFRERSWGAFSPRGLEVFRYKEAAQILRSRDFHIDLSDLSKAAGLSKDDGWISEHNDSIMLGMNGKEHAQARSMFTNYFTPRRNEQWRPMISEIVETLLDEAMESDTFDLAEQVCLKLPPMLFCKLIGQPASDAAFIARVSDAILKMFLRDPSYRASIVEASLELKEYVIALVAQRRSDPGDDFISYLLSVQEKAGMSDSDVLQNVAMFLEASSDNTGNQFSMAMVDLLTAPDRWRTVRDDPALLPAFIEESIRLHPRVGIVDRKCTVDTEINGVVIPAGTAVAVSVVSAHRDPIGLDDPDSFRCDRQERRQNLTFGGGPHHCIGVALAKLEIATGISVIARKLPHLRLNGDPDWTMIDRSMWVNHIPVQWRN